MILGVMIYANTMDAPFTFDDSINITENVPIRVTELTAESLTRLFTKSRAVYRPLANISFAANYYFHGYHVTGYHVVNLIIHILTALLVWRIARHTLRLCGMEDRLLPFLAAALWLVNPVHTQSVTYIVQRMNSMASMFFLLALLCYIKARIDSGSGRRRLRQGLFYGLCVISAVLGLASKQTVATLPVIIFLYEWFFFQNLDRAWLKRQIPWIGLVALLIFILALVYLGGDPLEKIHRSYKNDGITVGQRLLTEAGVVIYYIGLLLFPHPARLTIDHDFPLAVGVMTPASTALALAALAALLVAAVYSAGRHRLLSFTVLWFLVTLVIESSVIGLYLIYEHRTYLPSVFPVIGLSVLVYRYVRPRLLAVVILGALIGIFAFWTYQRNGVWADAAAFWENAIDKAPRLARPYINLGSVLKKNGYNRQAGDLFLKATQLDPKNADAYTLLGMLQLEQDQPEKAIPYFHKALFLKPDDMKHNHNLGVALAETGQTRKAIRLFRQVLAHFPYLPETNYQLARIYARRNELDKAAAFYKKAIKYQPDYFKAYNDLGIVYLMQKNISAAISSFEKAVSLNPDYMNAHLNLALVLQQKSPQKALDHAVRANQLAPTDPRPPLLAGDISISQGKISQAATYYEKAAVLQPANAKLMYNLACLYAMRNERDKAVDKLKQAVKNGYNDWSHLSTDKDLANIRETDYYQQLMRAYNKK